MVSIQALLQNGLSYLMSWVSGRKKIGIVILQRRVRLPKRDGIDKEDSNIA